MRYHLVGSLHKNMIFITNSKSSEIREKEKLLPLTYFIFDLYLIQNMQKLSHRQTDSKFECFCLSQPHMSTGCTKQPSKERVTKGGG